MGGVLSAGRACWTALTARAKAAIFCWALPPGADAAERLPPAGRAADRPLHGRLPVATGGGALGGRRCLPRRGGADRTAVRRADGPHGLRAALRRSQGRRDCPSPAAACGRAVAAIRQNYMALYGVEELSEQLGVTKSHLVRVFKQEMGCRRAST